MSDGVSRENVPFRLTELVCASLTEWRTGETLPARTSEAWQLVYLRSGVIEEQCDTHWITVRRGGLLFHQPNERHAMRAVSEVPPEVLRIEFRCDGAAMDLFRGRSLVANAGEKACLRALSASVEEVFEAPDQPDQPAALRQDAPFGAQQLMGVQLIWLLIMLTRRLRRPRKPSPRARMEQDQASLVEAVRQYFAHHIERELRLEEICTENECGRVQLQNAFRARTKMGPMEYFGMMRLEHAGTLLAQGYTPGQVAQRMHYSSGAYFAHRFKEVTGQTPSAYRKKPQPLHLCNK